MKKVNVTIKGISPLLMHAFPMQPVEALEKRSPEEQAELAAYRTPDGQLYIPGVNIQRALVGAGGYSKGKGRSTLKKPVAAGVFVRPEYCLLGTDKYEIDARPVVIRATGGRIIRYRPRLNEWSVSFSIEYDETLISEKQLRQVVDDAGTKVGLLDFRPENTGPFGRFMVTSWKEV